MRHPPALPSFTPPRPPVWPALGTPAGAPLSLWPPVGPRQPELHPRFAAYYTQLRALPRRVRRALQRQWRLPLAGIALVLALGQRPVQAATIPVGGPVRWWTPSGRPTRDTARGGCPAGSGADTIVLPRQHADADRVHNSTYGPTGLPVISSVITIAGQGSTIVRDSGAPIFESWR